MVRVACSTLVYSVPFWGDTVCGPNPAYWRMFSMWLVSQTCLKMSGFNSQPTARFSSGCGNWVGPIPTNCLSQSLLAAAKFLRFSCEGRKDNSNTHFFFFFFCSKFWYYSLRTHIFVSTLKQSRNHNKDVLFEPMMLIMNHYVTLKILELVVLFMR